MIPDHLKKYIDKHGFPGYTELRAQTNTSRTATLLNGDLITNSQSSSTGVSARVVKNGSYGFASSTDYDESEESIARVIETAARNADFLNSRVKLGREDFPKVEPLHNENGLEEDLPVSAKQMIEFGSDLDAYILERYPDLISRRVRVMLDSSEKLLYTSDSVSSHSFTPRSLMSVSLTAKGDDGTPVDVWESYGGYGNFNHALTDPKDYFDEVDRLYELLQMKAKGVWVEAGEHEVIIDSEICGLLAHEAVGHTVEADLVSMGSVAGPNFNKRVASDLVTLVDFAHHYDGKLCPVPVFVDDEGVPAKDVVLIDKGFLRAYMHNKESAVKYGHEALGNARANEFFDEPLIRMRNTCILPGESKLSDMISSIDNGYYLMKSGNGQADSTGEFMFGITAGYVIRGGKLAEGIKDTTISGLAFETLKTVSMVGDEIGWSKGGWCGKKQLITVGMGGPAIKAVMNLGGR